LWGNQLGITIKKLAVDLISGEGYTGLPSIISWNEDPESAYVGPMFHKAYSRAGVILCNSMGKTKESQTRMVLLQLSFSYI
jgi:hypothetical protein